MAHATGLWIMCCLFLYSSSYAADRYEIDIQKSQIHWTGRKPTGSHTGTIQISRGFFAIGNGNITEMDIEIDAKSIKTTDNLPSNWKNKLEDHLKSSDFFDALKFPTLTYKLTKSQKIQKGLETLGQLTIRGTTKPVKAIVFIENSVTPTLRSSFKIDRTQWGLTYKSKTIVDPKAALDSFIYDDIDVSGIIVAKTTSK